MSEADIEEEIAEYRRDEAAKKAAIERAMRDAAEEIRRLRRVNELLEAKVHVIEFMEMVLHTRPAQPSSGYGEDVAWKLDQLAAGMAEELKVAAE